MAILQSYYQDVYRSPVVRLSGYSGRHGLASSILAYLDFGGATGTCKDGVAETMLAFATERGTLKPGMPVVEASSGSFGAALAVSCATTGHPCILVVPNSLPITRRQHLQNLGARIVVCGSGGRRALEQVAKDTAERYNGYFTNYFSNDDNPEYHRRVTGPQILKAAGDDIDAVVVGVGSGGTITGPANAPPSRGDSSAIMALRALAPVLCPTTTTPMWWTRCSPSTPLTPSAPPGRCFFLTASPPVPAPAQPCTPPPSSWAPASVPGRCASLRGGVPTNKN